MIKNLVDYFPLHAETLKKTLLSDLIADEITANSQEGLMSCSIFQETVLINYKCWKLNYKCNNNGLCPHFSSNTE